MTSLASITFSTIPLTSNSNTTTISNNIRKPNNGGTTIISGGIDSNEDDFRVTDISHVGMEGMICNAPMEQQPLPSVASTRWYFTKEQLIDTPSRKCGIDPDKELAYRQQSANFIQDMGQRLQVNQLCINTAIVYMHRFYMFHSFTQFPKIAMSTASIFLAAKVEEQPRKLEYVIKIAHYCLYRDSQPAIDVKSEAYLAQSAEVVSNENILLQTLGFEVSVGHPHAHVVKCCQLVRASKDLAQTSYFMATNSLHLTTMCLQYPPSVVACVCIHLACKWSNWEIPRSKEGKEWYHYVDGTVTSQQLEQLTAEFLTIFNKSPSRLKKKILSLSNATSGGTGSGTIANFPTHFSVDKNSAGAQIIKSRSRSPSPTSSISSNKSIRNNVIGGNQPIKGVIPVVSGMGNTSVTPKPFNKVPPPPPSISSSGGNFGTTKLQQPFVPPVKSALLHTSNPAHHQTQLNKIPPQTSQPIYNMQHKHGQSSLAPSSTSSLVTSSLNGTTVQSQHRHRTMSSAPLPLLTSATSHLSGVQQPQSSQTSSHGPPHQPHYKPHQGQASHGSSSFSSATSTAGPVGSAFASAFLSSSNSGVSGNHPSALSLLQSSNNQPTSSSIQHPFLSNSISNSNPITSSIVSIMTSGPTIGSVTSGVIDGNETGSESGSGGKKRKRKHKKDSIEGGSSSKKSKKDKHQRRHSKDESGGGGKDGSREKVKKSKKNKKDKDKSKDDPPPLPPASVTQHPLYHKHHHHRKPSSKPKDSSSSLKIKIVTSTKEDGTKSSSTTTPSSRSSNLSKSSKSHQSSSKGVVYY